MLRNAIRRDRVAHAYLFWGPEGVGKSAAALAFAQALNCTSQERHLTGDACGECPACLLVAKGNHPDVRLITTPGDDQRTVIPIEEIRRDLVYDAHLKPITGRFKVYLLDPAERTAHLAIHTILKVLEEPPPQVVIVVVTSQPALLPPTVPSRCQQVAFQLVGTGAIEERLLAEGLEPATAASLARLSGGRIAWATRAAHQPQVLATRDALLELCADLDRQRVPASLRMAEEIKLLAAELAQASRAARAEEAAEEEDEEPSAAEARALPDRLLRAELPWCLDVMLSWYRDSLAAARGGALSNSDREEAIRASSVARDPGRAEAALEAILAARYRVQRNASIDLALEGLAAALVGGEE